MIDIFIDWLLANQVVLWLAVALFCLFFEMGSPGLFFFLSFFFGALLAAGVAFATTSWLWQSFFFALGSICAFLVLHFWVKRRARLFDTHTYTNIYALKLKKGKVLKEVGPTKMGRVKIDGETWAARSADGNVIEVGATVSVHQVKGAHLVVKKVSKPKPK